MANTEVKGNQKQEGSSQENSSGKGASSSGQQMTRSLSTGSPARSGFSPFLLTPQGFVSANPFTLMRQLSEEMDRAFGGFGSAPGSGNGPAWALAIEVSERNGNYIVCADLPGLKPEDVKVEVTSEALVIEGERQWQQEGKEGEVQRTERRYGQFYRSIPLPEGVNPEQVKANFQNGVLEITVPVPQQQNKSRQIPIETQSGASNGNTQAAKA